MYSIAQITGSLVVLVAFVLAQSGHWSSSGVRYLSLNAVGSAVLAAIALIGHEWGFLLLEGAWSLVSATGVYRALSPVLGIRRAQ
jgi:hypothetical protein